MIMRTLAIGDVHGCLTAMNTLMDFAEISETDRVVWLGDYVDRGPDTAGVLEALVAQRSNPNFVFLRGNHEVMMEEARIGLPEMRRWAMAGGDATWDSYAERFDRDGMAAVPLSHWEFIAELAPYFETETHVFVHASLDSQSRLSEQSDHDLYWGSFSSTGPHLSGKPVICGHSSQKDGLPKSVGHASCIDTWACGEGWLTCLDVDRGWYWQANQQGETRADWLAGYSA